MPESYFEAITYLSQLEEELRDMLKDHHESNEYIAIIYIYVYTHM